MVAISTLVFFSVGLTIANELEVQLKISLLEKFKHYPDDDVYYKPASTRSATNYQQALGFRARLFFQESLLFIIDIIKLRLFRAVMRLMIFNDSVVVYTRNVHITNFRREVIIHLHCYK